MKLKDNSNCVSLRNVLTLTTLSHRGLEILSGQLNFLLGLEIRGQLEVLRIRGQGPGGLAALIEDSEAGAGIDEDLTNRPPLVGGRLVERSLALLIVLPVHDELLVLALLDQELDDLLVPEPRPVVQPRLAGLVSGHEGVALLVQFCQHLEVAQPGRLEDAISCLLTPLVIRRRDTEYRDLVLD